MRDPNICQPFTNHFPRADIHTLITPDLLHQVIKGTFKDHLVTWVEQYVHLTAETERDAKNIMDDIDRRYVSSLAGFMILSRFDRIAAAPPFPGLRRFPEGRNFKQWTGDDSKALMKVLDHQHLVYALANVGTITGIPARYSRPCTR